MVAVLSIAVQFAVPAAIWAVKTTVTEPLAGTVMPVMFRKPSLLVPVPAPVDELVAPAGKLVTVKPLRFAGISSVTLALTAMAPADSVSVMVYCKVLPTTASPPLVLATSLDEVDRSGSTMVVTLVAVLLAELKSRLGLLATVAVLVTELAMVSATLTF